MEEWKEYKIKDLCHKVYSGGTPLTSRKEYYDGPIPWLNTKEVNFNRIYATERYITQEGLNNSSAQWVASNSIIIAMYGATAGKVALTKIPLTTNQACCNLIINQSVVDYNYLYYALCHEYPRLSLLANGGAQQNLSAQVIKEYPIFIPSRLEEQQRISNILSSLDGKIEINRRINDNLEQQATALFDKMFPSITNGNGKIGDWLRPKRGIGLLTKDTILGDVPVVAGGLRPAAYHNKANTLSPVVTISASGANAGYVALWNKPVWSSDSSYIDSSLTSDVYFWYVMLKKRQKEIFDAQTGSAQPHIYPQHIAELPIKQLEKEQIIKYTEQVTPLFKMVGNLTTS